MRPMTIICRFFTIGRACICMRIPTTIIRRRRQSRRTVQVQAKRAQTMPVKPEARKQEMAARRRQLKAAALAAEKGR